MFKAILFFGTIAATLASGMLLYISLATPIGPWVEPVIILAALGVLTFLKIFRFKKITQAKELISYIALSGGVAGIAAVACGFTIPTLYFLDSNYFKTLLNSKYFIPGLAFLILLTGLIAFTFASIFEDKFLSNEELDFPEVQLTYKILSIGKGAFNILQFFGGALITGVFEFLKTGLKLIPEKLILLKSIKYKLIEIPQIAIRSNITPMMLALGFVTGHIITVPLLTGLFTKILFISPLQKIFFKNLPLDQTIVAFCAGLVLFGALFGFLKIISKIVENFRHFKFRKGTIKYSIRYFIENIKESKIKIALIILSLTTFALYFLYFKFSIPSLFYLFIFTIICVYQLTLIAGKIGLAPLGRFATFVMLPGLIIFGYTPLQATLVSAFVEFCGGISVNLIFGRQLIKLTNGQRNYAIIAQILGLVIASITISIFFWKLGISGTLGHAPLIAQRAYNRAMLISVNSFDPILVLIGMIIAFIYQFFSINIVLVMTSLLMPLEYTLPLIIGGLLSKLVKKRYLYYPFWAGIFATSSLILIAQIIFKI